MSLNLLTTEARAHSGINLNQDTAAAGRKLVMLRLFGVSILSYSRRAKEKKYPQCYPQMVVINAFYLILRMGYIPDLLFSW
jgi:hypothetical protein